MKKVSICIFCFLFMFFLFGCNNITTTISPSSTTTTSSTTTSKYNMTDFYEKLVIYQERMNSIVNSRVLEPLAHKTLPFNPIVTSDNGTITIYREDILASHYNSDFDMVYDDYFDQLITTQEFVSSIKTMIEGQENIQLYEEFHPNDSPSSTFRFIYSEEDYILIDSLIGMDHSYLKIGLDNDLLVYHELHYYYASNSLSIKDSINLEFNYFKFEENKEAVYVNYSKDNSSLRFTSIEHDEQFTISSGYGVIEGPESDDVGYVLNMYDRDLNCQIYLQIINDEIISETYDIFDEYGLVYRYEDIDLSDDSINLAVNFVTATGWDYVVASNYTSTTLDQLTGIFLADGTKIYDDWFNYTYTPTYGYLGMRIHLDNALDFTNETLSLNQYGLILEHPKATVDYFNQIHLTNFSQIKNHFYIDNLNYFSNDLHEELYQYIDLDIRNDIEGVNDEPIITTGDVEAFNDALEIFQNNLLAFPKYTSNGRLVTQILDDDRIISQSYTDTYDMFDLTAMYYSSLTNSTGNMNNQLYRYVLDGTKGQLIEYEIIQETAVKYEILETVATYSDFIDIYDSLVQSSGLSEVIHITKTNDRTYELEVTPKFLNSSGIDTNLLLEQQGITGLDDQKIIITYEFAQDFLSFDVDFTIANLALDNYEVKMMSSSTTVIEPFVFLSPLDTSYYTFYLPKSLNQFLFTTTSPSYSYWYLDQGTLYMQLYLNPGEYSININGDYGTPKYKVYNESMEEIPYDIRFTAPIQGYYYVVIDSEYKQGASFQINSNPTPVYYDFAVENTDSTLSMDLSIGNFSVGRITVPSSSVDRLMIIYSHNIIATEDNTHIEVSLQFDDIYYFDSFYPNDISQSESETAYFFLPKDREI